MFQLIYGVPRYLDLSAFKFVFALFTDKHIQCLHVIKLRFHELNNPCIYHSLDGFSAISTLSTIALFIRFKNYPGFKRKMGHHYKYYRLKRIATRSIYKKTPLRLIFHYLLMTIFSKFHF